MYIKTVAVLDKILLEPHSLSVRTDMKIDSLKYFGILLMIAQIAF